MVKIKWEKNAVLDLQEIYEYIANDSLYYAQLETDRILNCIDKLISQPDLGKSLRQFKNTGYREIIESNYRIIYEIYSPDVIFILFVHHGARDLTSRLKK